MSELSKIAAISGEGGLFLIHAPVKNGVVMESLDERKIKIVAGPTSKVSVLSEISIFTTTSEGSVPLESVLKSLHDKHKKSLPVTSKSDASDLKKVLLEALPEADLDRVYTSDIKKLVSWYHILVNQVPELWEEKEEKTEAPKAVEKAEKPKKEAKPKAPKKAKD
ncbi:MAG TPA: DUF5606 domain-containing protein [Catalimonadaceae bacterium]|nr:DUF5606 domain-containing protein [Catalimonadaceae bacterium]